MSRNIKRGGGGGEGRGRGKERGAKDDQTKVNDQRYDVLGGRRRFVESKYSPFCSVARLKRTVGRERGGWRVSLVRGNY